MTNLQYKLSFQSYQKYGFLVYDIAGEKSNNLVFEANVWLRGRLAEKITAG